MIRFVEWLIKMMVFTAIYAVIAAFIILSDPNGEIFDTLLIIYLAMAFGLSLLPPFFKAISDMIAHEKAHPQKAQSYHEKKPPSPGLKAAGVISGVILVLFTAYIIFMGYSLTQLPSLEDTKQMLQGRSFVCSYGDDDQDKTDDQQTTAESWSITFTEYDQIKYQSKSQEYGTKTRDIDWKLKTANGNGLFWFLSRENQ